MGEARLPDQLNHLLTEEYQLNGYAGKILRVDLAARKVREIATKDYEQWGGGHGMGSAIFFDLVKDKNIDGFDPANVVTIMTSPLCGTLVPAAGGRTEVQGISVQSYPIGWFTRSNFGGRFSAMLKLKESWGTFQFQSPPAPIIMWAKGRPKIDQRPQACMGCHSGCRARYRDAAGNEASCFSSVFCWDATSLDIQRLASDLINRYGLNAVEMIFGLLYIGILAQTGQLTTGEIPDCPLDFRKYRSGEFIEQFAKMIAYGDDGNGNESQFGRDVSGGFVWAAEKWGRRKRDLDSGILAFPYWGLPLHKEPRAQVYWGYATLLGDRDINEHGLDWLKHEATAAKGAGREPRLPAHQVVKIITDKIVPFQGDMDILDFSEGNIYSEHMAKMVAWQRYHTRFWKQSMLFCDARWPDFVNIHRSDNIGATGLVEPEYLKAVTGKDLSFLDGINLGRKIWNLDHAIWTLQVRHRDMVHFADHVYQKHPVIQADVPNAYTPGKENGVWDYDGYSHRKLDRDGFDEFKTHFYELEGCDPTTGFPTRAALESLGLGYVADELEEQGKLGDA